MSVEFFVRRIKLASQLLYSYLLTYIAVHYITSHYLLHCAQLSILLLMMILLIIKERERKRESIFNPKQELWRLPRKVVFRVKVAKRVHFVDAHTKSINNVDPHLPLPGRIHIFHSLYSSFSLCVFLVFVFVSYKVGVLYLYLCCVVLLTVLSQTTFPNKEGSFPLAHSYYHAAREWWSWSWKLEQ